MTAASREQVLAVIGTNRNGWMWHFHNASHAIAAAVVDGRIRRTDLALYEPYNPEQSSRLASAAGLDPDRDPEDVALSVEAIVGLAGKPLEPYGDPWHLYAEDAEEVGTTFDALSAFTATLDIVDAAQVIVDADAWLTANATYGGQSR